ncbi:hypothetical protein GOP47_0018747 [Adiantum capillus-veneris]|uniref:Uncharacterized protein n=1 Tax=Adiantum capillus-veneris TaxID=13818 RepID=A0A9D4UEQ5_ADICA|nr:hypothetical protein GOP47_0018747 [Adiantum capillus-veneris]
MKHLGSDESLQGKLVCMNFTLAYLCVLEDKVKNSDWSHEKFLIETRQGNNYWEEVQEQTEKFLGVITQKDGLTKIQQSKQITWATWETKAHLEFVRLWPNSMMQNAQKLEARHLVRNDNQLNCFLPIRRVTRAIRRCGIVVLFMDTSSEISNFSALDWADPLDQVAAGNVKLAPPIWGTFSTDISGKDSLQLFPAKTLNSIASRIEALRYGRPLWWATFRSCLPYLRKGKEYPEHAKLGAFEVTRGLTQDKLLGGAGKLLEHIIKDKDLPEEVALSLLGATIGLDVDPHFELASKLVANHLLSILSVLPSRELLCTARRGFTGELVAKIILLEAKKKGEKIQSGLWPQPPQRGS